MTKLLWLPTVLREAGLKVEEVTGWKTRGHGDMGDVEGILCHHTAGGKHGNYPSLSTVRDGRPGLKGPLSQFGLGRDGTWFIIAAGKSWHAGSGNWHGITNGNTVLIGIEAENTGYTKGANAEAWPEVQMDSYARGCAAILEYLKLPVSAIAGHKEYALPKGRKVDPTFDMDLFRERIKNIMASKKKSLKTANTYQPEKPPFEGEDIVAGFEAWIEPGHPDLPMEEPVKWEYSLAKEEPVKSATKETTANKLQGRDRVVYAKNLLTELGWKDYQVAALVGNAMVESGPDLNTETVGDYMIGKKVVVKGTEGALPCSYGIMRWPQRRLVHLRWFSDDLGVKKNIWKSTSDLEVQVRFIDWELHNTEKVAGKQLLDSEDMMEALRAVISYIRPIGWTAETPESGAGWKDRLVAAYGVM